jgi:hypothetical protein
MRDREMAKLRTQCATEYWADISAWDWDGIVSDATADREFDPDAACMIGRVYLGSVLKLRPSGKVYAPWTSNQTELDELKDEVWHEVMDAIASEQGGYIDGDDDLFFCIAVDTEDEDSAD